MKRIVVQKFGGTTVGDPEKIKLVAKEISDLTDLGYSIVAVVSAMGEQTDDLIKLARSVSENPDSRELDMLVSVGERISISLLSMALKNLGKDAISFTGSQAGIITDCNHCDARILRITPGRIKESLESGKIAIIAGFQGVSEKKEITTLGRGGSDTSAVALACVLGAQFCDIFTDVDGVFCADPKLMEGTKLLSEIGYEEMMEMAYLGAKVMHPRAVEIASRYGLVVRVKNIDNYFKEKSGGKTTLIKNTPPSLEGVTVKGLTTDNEIILVSAYFETDDSLRFLRYLSENNVNAKNFSSEKSEKYFRLTLLLSSRQLNAAREAAKVFGCVRFEVSEDFSLVSLVGTGSGNSPEIMGRLFSILMNNGSKINMLSASEVKVSFLLEKEKASSVLKDLAYEFGLFEEE
ncbi:aspartate kinase [candidate division WOR-3 bacterium]|nr:aspartate kinase [candidate division WOR-3 bacterium]